MARSRSHVLVAFVRSLSTISYNAGSATKVKTVEVIKPPIKAIAIGCCNSAPAPHPIAIGSTPSPADAAVISTGRIRVCAPT
jgi:hypothetical protein